MSRASFAPLVARRGAAGARPASKPAVGRGGGGTKAGSPRFMASPSATPAAAKSGNNISQRHDRWEGEAHRASRAAIHSPPIASVATPKNSAPAAVKRTEAAHGPPVRARVVDAAPPVASAGPGRPLSPALRRRLEAAFHTDLSSVRVHTGPGAEKAAAGVQARAFAQHNHIYLGAGESPDDLPLIAHETAHAIQQTATLNAAWPQGPPVGGSDLTFSRAEPGMIQRLDFDPLGAASGALNTLEDTAAAGVHAVADLAGEAFWAAVDTLAPAIAPLLHEIHNSEGGFFGFIRGKISGAFDAVFARLKSDGGTVGKLAVLFEGLMAQGKTIASALAAGDCEPLFHAVRSLGALLSKMAGDAWNKIVDFLAPIGHWLADIWNKFGAPVVDFLKEFAADAWDFITGIGKKIWDFTKPVRDSYANAWSEIKKLLGFDDSGGDDSSSGLIGWIKDTAGKVWESIKEELKPVIEPIKQTAEAIEALIPIDAILHLRDKIDEWLDKATAMADNMDQPGDVAENRDLLKTAILPGVKRAIEGVRTRVASASQWATGAVTGLVGKVNGFFGSLAGNKWLSPFRGAIQWVEEEVTALGDWVTLKVGGVFDTVDHALVTLEAWVEPVLLMLKKLVDALGNLMGRLGDLVLGPLMLVPKCIRDPIKDFILKQILGRIPIFKQIVELPELWVKAQKVFRTIVVQIFADGDLLGAAWTFFKAICELFNLPPKLITDLIRNAAKAFKDILHDPLGFLINCIKAATKGLRQFIDNIWPHLLQGLADWLFGQLKDVAIKVPKQFSLGGVFDIVAQILGLSMDHILTLIEKKKGKVVADAVRKAIAVGAFVVKWLKVLIDKGPIGFWEEIKNNLSDLWDTVIDKVQSFVMEKVVQAATRWLLGFLDVSGITPAINTVIAIYNAIESFVAYLKEILEIVNSVFLGVSDIAKGALDRAANFVENAAVRVLPIAIGFLANQLGLGKIGLKVKEVVGDIRKKVDDAIEKLIEMAGNVWDSAKDAAKRGVAAIFNWWKARETAKTESGEEHAVYLEGEPGSTKLMVASAPIDADEAIARIADSDLTPPKKAAAKSEALGYKATIDASVKVLVSLNNAGATPGNKAQDDDRITAENKKMRAAMRSLVVLLADSVFGSGKWDDLDDTVVSYSNSAKASTAEATKLTAKRNMGSPPSVNPPGWDFIVQKKLTDNAPNYVRLHLINENFEGSGADRGNLVPGSKQNNGDHLRSVENPLKDLVGAQPKDKSKKAEVWYTANVHYYAKGKESTWDPVVKNAGVTSNDFAESIDFRWGLYKRKSSGWTKDAAPIGNFKLGPIPLPDLR